MYTGQQFSGKRDLVSIQSSPVVLRGSLCQLEVPPIGGVGWGGMLTFANTDV